MKLTEYAAAVLNAKIRGWPIQRCPHAGATSTAEGLRFVTLARHGDRMLWLCCAACESRVRRL
jgi:hypothetical protein